MKKTTITIILALALCLSLAVPAFAAETMTYEHYGLVLEITNVISKEVISWEETWGTYEGVTTYYTTAPTTVTFRTPVGLGEHGSFMSKITEEERINDSITDWSNYVPLTIISGEQTFENGERIYGEGSAYVLTEGTYVSSSTQDFSLLYFVVGGSGSSPPPQSVPAPTVPAPPAANDIKVLVNGTAVSFDQPPIIQNGRTLVPLRAIFEALGATVDYEQSTQTLTAVRENVTVIMQIGNSVFTVNGNQKTLDVAPQIIGGRTLVPARAIAESFGAEVGWDAATQTMTISMG